MNDNKIMKEKISALADGELSDFETRRILEEIKNNSEYREFWKNIHLSKDLLKEKQSFFFKGDLSQTVRQKLKQTQTAEIKKEDKRAFKKLHYFTASFIGFLAIVSFSYLAVEEESFAAAASVKINAAINSPEAMEVLNNSVSDLNVILQDVQTNHLGTLASYRMANSDETFRLRLYPIKEINKIDLEEATKISYLTRNGKIFVVSISGNLSADKKNLILQKANLFTEN